MLVKWLHKLSYSPEDVHASKRVAQHRAQLVHSQAGTKPAPSASGTPGHEMHVALPEYSAGARCHAQCQEGTQQQQQHSVASRCSSSYWMRCFVFRFQLFSHLRSELLAEKSYLSISRSLLSLASAGKHTASSLYGSGIKAGQGVLTPSCMALLRTHVPSLGVEEAQGAPGAVLNGKTPVTQFPGRGADRKRVQAELEQEEVCMTCPRGTGGKQELPGREVI